MIYTVRLSGMIPADNEAFCKFQSEFPLRTLSDSSSEWKFEVVDKIFRLKGQAINDFLDSRPCVESYSYEE